MYYDNILQICSKHTQPIANEVIFPSIDEHFHSILNKCRNSHFQISHPVRKHSLVYYGATGNKFYVSHAQRVSDRFLVEELLHVGEVVTKVTFALLSDVIIL